MVELSIEDLRQLVVFYKQKCSDVELDLLKSQLKVARLVLLTTSTEDGVKPVVDKGKK